MTRPFISVCAGLFVLVALTFSFSTRSPRADFTYVNPTGIHTLDPARMSWTQDIRVALNLWEGLTTWDPRTLEPIAGAGQLPPQISSDGLTYTFVIRPEARWSNGDPLTAEDFVRGWRRAIEPGTAADYAFLITETIAGAAEYAAWRNSFVERLSAPGEAVDANQRDPVIRAHAGEMDAKFALVGLLAENDKTLSIRLKRPCPYLLDILGFAVFVPIHSSIELLRERHLGCPINAQGLVVYDTQWTKPRQDRNPYGGLVTNGPYRLVDWQFKRRARLALNPYYHGAAEVRSRTVDMLEYDNVSASLMAFEAGDVDFLTDLGVPYEHELFRLAREGLRSDFKPCSTAATYFFNFNCQSREVDGRMNPFLDARVRRAFTLAADRAAIVEHVRKRGDRVARSFVPPGTITGYEPPEGLPYDPASARRLLAEAGFADPAALGEIELLYPPSQEKVCQALARLWEDALGVRVALRAQESKTFAADKAARRYLIAWGSWYADYNDPTTFLDCLTSGNGNNDTGYSSALYDSLMAAAAKETAGVQRMHILKEAETLAIGEDCPILPILHMTELIAVSPRVSGLHPNPRLWFPFRHVSVTR